MTVYKNGHIFSHIFTSYNTKEHCEFWIYSHLLLEYSQFINFQPLFLYSSYKGLRISDI